MRHMIFPITFQSVSSLLQLGIPKNFLIDVLGCKCGWEVSGMCSLGLFKIVFVDYTMSKKGKAV